MSSSSQEEEMELPASANETEGVSLEAAATADDNDLPEKEEEPASPQEEQEAQVEKDTTPDTPKKVEQDTNETKVDTQDETVEPKDNSDPPLEANGEKPMADCSTTLPPTDTDNGVEKAVADEPSVEEPTVDSTNGMEDESREKEAAAAHVEPKSEPMLQEEATLNDRGGDAVDAGAITPEGGQETTEQEATAVESSADHNMNATDDLVSEDKETTVEAAADNLAADSDTQAMEGSAGSKEREETPPEDPTTPATDGLPTDCNMDAMVDGDGSDDKRTPGKEPEKPVVDEHVTQSDMDVIEDIGLEDKDAAAEDSPEPVADEHVSDMDAIEDIGLEDKDTAAEDPAKHHNDMLVTDQDEIHNETLDVDAKTDAEPLSTGDKDTMDDVDLTDGNEKRNSNDQQAEASPKLPPPTGDESEEMNDVHLEGTEGDNEDTESVDIVDTDEKGDEIPSKEDSRESPVLAASNAPPATPERGNVSQKDNEPTSPSGTVTSQSAELPSLEECLYGAHLKDNEEVTHQDKETMDEDLSEHHNMVHDDWNFVRDPGLWKKHPHFINMTLLRKIASQHGILEEGSHRAVAWRILLGYLPPDNREWESVLEKKRNQYKDLVRNLFQDASDCMNGEELRWKRRMPKSRHSLTPGDDDKEAQPNTQEEDSEQEQDSFTLTTPVKRELDRKGLDPQILEGIMKDMNALHIRLLRTPSADESTSGDGPGPTELTEQKSQVSAQEDASYGDFVESANLLDQIRKDVDRTFPDLAFFLDPERNLGKRRYAALERILFVWSKYNKGVKYVQGMNEIVGTLYYVMANDWNEEWAIEAEADTYWIFSILLTDMQDVFVADLDSADTGIQGRILLLETLLKRHDPEVKDHLDEIGVECSFYAIRWWTTLLTREFLLPDTIRLWDSMFASTHKDNFLCYVCVTMIIMIRESLLKGDFSHCLRTLQAYPSVPMDSILHSSRSLWIYERQITLACRKGGMGLHQALKTVPPPASIVMAFGFEKGIAAASPMTRAEKLELASERAAASVREATTAVAASAKGWLGKASNFYNRIKLQRSESTESVKSDDALKIDEIDEDLDCVYLQAIEGAETGKFSYK